LASPGHRLYADSEPESCWATGLVFVGLTLIVAKPTQCRRPGPPPVGCFGAVVRLKRSWIAPGNLFADVTYGSLREDVGYP
jgi:hypothetical protein